MPSPLPLSVVIITRNEESRLRECLDSVRWAGEILVVDDESTDRTVEVASEYTDRVLRRKMDIEGRHRNWAYAQAKNDWIFSLDADERITPELAAEVQNLLSNPENTPFKVYTVPRKNYIGSRWVRHGGWYPSPQIKLFKRSVFRWEETTVHPRAISDCPTGALRGDLIHLSYRNLSDFVGKLNRQTTLEAEKWLLDKRAMTLLRALWRSADRFWRSYRAKKGYRDGVLGWILSMLAGSYQWLSYAKYRTQASSPAPGMPTKADPQAARHDFWRGRGHSEPAGDAAVSCVLIVKNEAHRIQPCLDSLRWANEVVIVDDHSDDETSAIAAKWGAKVVHRLSNGDFNAQRNHGIEIAEGPWVLQMDADEVISKDLAQEILRHTSPQQSNGCAAYQITRRNHFLGNRMRHGGWAGQKGTKLFQKGKARYVGRGVHETLKVDGAVGHLDQPIDHYPFSSIQEFVDRQNFYTSVEAQILAEESPDLAGRRLESLLKTRPLKIFWKAYVKKRGFLDGWTGFLFAVLFAWVEFLRYGKVWEIRETQQAG